MDDSLESKAWETIIRVPEVGFNYDGAALLIIDLQYGFASRSHGVFKRLTEQGIGESAEYAIGRIEKLVVPNVARLAGAMRERGRPVFYFRCASIRGDGADQTRRHRAQRIGLGKWKERSRQACAFVLSRRLACPNRRLHR